MTQILIILSLFSFLFSDLLKPQNQSILSSIHILFEWDQEPDAIEYNIQISDNELFETILLDSNTSNTLYIEKNIINWDNNFFWRVRPIYNNQLYGEWINQLTFSTSSPILQEIDATIFNDDLLQEGLIIFGQFSPSLVIGVIDKFGNEIWNNQGSSLENNLVAFLSYVSNYGQLFGTRNQQGINFNYNKDILWQSPINTEIDIHEIQQLPNNNYMSFVPVYELGPIVEDERWTFLFQNLGYQADGSTIEFPWLGQKIIEWDQNTGEEVWSWNPFNHISMDDHDIGGELWQDAYISGRFDWLHSNSFHFDSEENVIYISHRHLNRICKIAYPSGEVLWNIGPSEEYNMGDNNICTNLNFSWQHHVQLIEDGDLLFFDNGNLSQLLMGDENPTSRIRRIRVNDDYTCDTIWQYDLPDYLFGPGTGSVQLLNNDNYLIYTLGNYDNCSILEVTPDKELIWLAEASDPESTFYRTYKIPSIHPSAFSIEADNFILSNNNEIIQVTDNEIKFIVYNHSDYTQDYSYNFIDSDNVMFNDSQGDFTIPPNESINLHFYLNNVEIDATQIMLNLIPTHHKYAEKQLVFNVSNSNLDNTISINNFKLSNVYPNPFNPTTTISYDVSNLADIKISIYNMNGQVVEVLISKLHQPGTYNIIWSAEEYPSGFYFIELSSDEFLETKKITLIK